MYRMTFDASIEPILKPNLSRFIALPIEYPDLYELAVKQRNCYWLPHEVDLSKDLQDWNNLNDDEQFYIKNILAFFAASDGIVNENLAVNFYKDVQISEARSCYAIQMAVEDVHAEMYAILIDTYVSSTNERRSLFNAIQENDAVKAKALWALKWIEGGEFNERLLAFIIVEGIFFSGSFASIFWLKSRGKMHGLTMSNEFIARDEGLHCQTGIAIYSKLVQKLTTKRVYEIIQDAVAIEQNFTTKSLPVSLIGMNAELMAEYIEYVADYWLVQLGYPKLYNTENPLDYMNYISLENKTNFFETRVSNYNKAGLSTQYSMDDDF